MPYSIRKEGRSFAIVNKATRKPVGRSTTRAKAQASIRARMASERRKKG